MKEELWEEFGKALGMSEEQLEKISLEEEGNMEKCKQCVLNVSPLINPRSSASKVCQSHILRCVELYYRARFEKSCKSNNPRVH